MSDDSRKITTYLPDNSIRNGYWKIPFDILKEISRNRWLIYQLFKRDFLTIYKQSFIGILWALIIPVISVGTFILLNKSGILSTGSINIPYPVYAICGMTLWQLFASGIVACSGALVKAGPMIVKINFSKKSLVIASLGQAVIAFLIQIILLTAVCIYYSYIPSAKILYFPLLILPILLITLGAGLILSIFNGISRDVGNAVGIMINFLMFLTPVLYAKPESGLLSAITKYNPLYYLVSIPRDFLLTGIMDNPAGYITASIISLLLFCFCITAFHLTESRITERI